MDDFTVSAPSKEITDKVFAMIQEKLTEPLKMLDKLNLHNGIDIIQGRHFIIVSGKSYLTKISKAMDGWNNRQRG